MTDGRNPSVDYKDQWDVTDVCVNGDTASLELWYPGIRDVKFLKIGLMDVRAADDIRVSYDFERDGWKIEQASRFSWTCEDDACDPDWQEVAFVQAWARKETEVEEHRRLGWAT